MNERIFRGQMIRPRPADNSGDIYRPDNGINPQPIESMSGYSSPVEFYNIDITTAHTDFAIRVPKCMYIQTVCDGISDGISIKLVDQSREAFPLDKVKTIPSPGINRIYVTNDVRQGRSKLTIMFWQTEPAGLSDQAQNITLAEAAVRNGSIVSFDRRGEVIFKSDLNNGLGAYHTGSGTKVLSTDQSLTGDLSIKLTTGAAAGNEASLTKYLTVSSISKFGIECSFNLPAANLRRIYVSIRYYDGVNTFFAGLAYNAADNTYEYITASGPVWTAFQTSKNLYSITSLFHTLKLVADFSGKKYARGIVNNEEFNMSNYALPSAASAINPCLIVVASIVTNAAAAITGYADRFIITQNEP